MHTYVRQPAVTRGGPLAALAALLVVACGDAPVTGAARPPRAVLATTLVESRPRAETLTVGVVEPFRQSELSFDVSGLVTFSLDVGQEADGPQLDGRGDLLRDAEGEVVRRGEVVATVDDVRFRQAVAAAEQAIATTLKQIESSSIEIETVVAAQLDNARATAEAARSEVVSARQSVAVAESDLELAVTTVDRDRRLITSGAIAQSVLDESEAQYRSANATLARENAALESALRNESAALAGVSEIEGTRLVKEADLVVLEAQRAEREIDLEQARTDLASCTLRAPFSGRVTRKLVSKGDYVNAGESIVELTLISPVKVVLTASGAQERELPLGVNVPIYGGAGDSEDAGSTVYGTVYEKSNVADTGTRTFRIGLVSPNDRLLPPPREGEPALADVTDFFPVIAADDDPSGALLVSWDCIYEEGGETYVLRLPGVDAESWSASAIRVPVPTRVEVSDEWAQIDSWSLRRLADAGGLESGDALVRNPGEDDRAGVRIGSTDYRFRPGDVVRVGLDVALPPVGLWVPATAILARAGESVVFVVQEGRATSAVVEVHESSGELRRITGEGVREGTRLVLSGVAFLSDGDAISIVSGGE